MSRTRIITTIITTMTCRQRMIGALGAAHDGQSGHGDHDRLHVHYDACCPSIIVPAPVSLVLDQGLGATVDPPPTRALHGASPSRLLRPPIV